MKRLHRELAERTKQKISQSMKGKTKSLTHRKNISLGLKRYWQTIPNKIKNNDIDEE